MMDIKEVFLQWFIKFVKNISNKESSTELQKAIITKFQTLKVQLPLTDNIWGKAIITKFETLKVQSPLTDNIWGADLAEI